VKARSWRYNILLWFTDAYVKNWHRKILMWFTEVYITNMFVKLTVFFSFQMREEYIITFIQHFLNSIV